MTTAHRRIVRIVAIYAAFAAAWILLSDKVLEGVVEDPALRTHVSIAKGWAFVAVTSGLLYALMRRAWRLTEEAIAQRLESLSLLETIANGVDDAVFAKDTAGRYLLFNQAAARFVGKTVPEVLGQDDRALFPPEQAGMLMELGVRVMREGVTRTREEILSLPDGSTRVFLATKGPLRSPDGRLLGIFGISRDITAQKAALAALQASEERLHLFIERAPAALAMFDRNMV
ncbi:MAG TPA: PAS domain-containing protein, partial [Nitrospira sp.]|nr:PAS domain-containing protein [Nitrospira sp.]